VGVGRGQRRLKYRKVCFRDPEQEVEDEGSDHAQDYPFVARAARGRRDGWRLLAWK
jgi:hypothetical protein